MEEHIKLGFTFASDISKQLITLSTAILTLLIAFSKDIIRGLSSKRKWILTFVWVVFFLSIIFGVWSLMALTGTLVPLDNTTSGYPRELKQNVRLPAGLQIISFFIAIVLTIIYGIMGLFERRVTECDSTYEGGND